MVTGLTSRTYEGRLQELGLPSLELRRERGDYIQAFRILTGVDKVNPTTWFDLAKDRPRLGAATTRQTDSTLAIEPRRANTQLRRNFFSVRIADKFNNLPEEIKAATTVNSFKNMLDKFLGLPALRSKDGRGRLRQPKSV